MRYQCKKKIISAYGVTIGNCPWSILQAGETHQLTANVAPIDATDKTVSWSSSNPEVASVDENGVVTAISQGSVKITIITNDGAYTNACNIGVMGTTSGSENYEINNIVEIYPNPPSDKLFVEFSKTDKNREIKIFNSRGQLIYSEDADGLKNQIDISRLETGLLVIQIKSRQGCYMQKVFIQ